MIHVSASHWVVIAGAHKQRTVKVYDSFGDQNCPISTSVLDYIKKVASKLTIEMIWYSGESRFNSRRVVMIVVCLLLQFPTLS